MTFSDLYYEGSLAIDQDLMDASGIFPYERILVVNANNGARLETYAIPADRKGRTIGLNGAAARLGIPGDMLTIMSFAQMTEEEARSRVPKIIVMDETNTIIERKGSA